MPYVHKDHLHDTLESAIGGLPPNFAEGWKDNFIEVTVVKAQSKMTEAEEMAVAQLADYAEKLWNARGKRPKSFRWKKQDGTLNEGGRLALAALRDARAEACAAAQENHDVDVLNGESPEQFAVYYLMSVIDWCDEHWVKNPIGCVFNTMEKYFCLASMFRKGKWQARATWPDLPVTDQPDAPCGEEW